MTVRGLSIKAKLPLLIGSLLVAVTLIYGWAAYQMVRGSMAVAVTAPARYIHCPVSAVTATRLLPDRRYGIDRRTLPRRQSVTAVPVERRRVVDRRWGADRRSTLERRGRPQRNPAQETPGEHLRNALQLLRELHFIGEPTFDAAVARLEHALDLLEKRR